MREEIKRCDKCGEKTDVLYRLTLDSDVTEWGMGYPKNKFDTANELCSTCAQIVRDLVGLKRRK